jgi:hypothetical protein
MFMEHLFPSTAPAPEHGVPAHVVRALAVAAQVDPATVKRVLAGQPTRQMCRARVLEAIDRLAATTGDRS